VRGKGGGGGGSGAVRETDSFNPLNAELNPIYHLLVLLRAHHIFHVSGLRVKCTLERCFRILLPFFRTSWSVSVLNSAIFNSFHNRVEFVTILEGLRNFGGGLNTPNPPPLGTPLSTAAGLSPQLYIAVGVPSLALPTIPLSIPEDGQTDKRFTFMANLETKQAFFYKCSQRS